MRGARSAAQGQPPAAEGAGFRRLPTDLEGGVVESRHGLAQRRRKGTRRAFRKRPGDAGGRAALHPLHARQQNNIGSIGRRMDSPAAVPPSPREDGATATPPRRSPPRVSAPPLRHRCDRPSPPCCFAVVPWCLRCYSDLPLFAALLSADFAVFGSLLPVHGHLHARALYCFFACRLALLLCQIPPR